jgi:pimeloyl-ACP methyl ester carboxylesterase
MEPRSLEVNGIRLSVREWPGAGRPLLLLHGLASSSHIWDLVAPRLQRAGHHVVAYDERGHGLSSKPSSGYGFDRVAGDATGVIRALRLDGPVVVGHSWGANVALELAVRRPSSVAGAMLVDGGFLNLGERMNWETCREELAPPDLKGTPVHEFLEMLRYFLHGQIEITPEVEAVFLSLMRVDAHGDIHPQLSRANHLRILRALWEQDSQGLLRLVRVPTLVLGVRSPPGVPDSAGFMQEKERAAEVVRAIGGHVRFKWIDGIHDVPLQRPEAIARRITGFAGHVVA